MMDDLTGKLSSILDDPQSMETIRSLASSLIGDSDSPANALSSLLKQQKPRQEEASLIPDISPEQIGAVMRVMSALNSKKSDNRTALLMALRPHLSEQRRERLDKAAKLLKLASVLPMIGESGLFNF